MPPTGVAQAGQAVMGEVQGLKERVESLTSDVKRKRKGPKEMQEAMFLLMEKYDFTPMEELFKMATEKTPGGEYVLDASQDKKLRADILMKLMEFVVPKLKSVDVTGTVDHNHQIHILRYGEDGKVTKEALVAPNGMKALPSVVRIAAGTEITDVESEVRGG